MYVIRLPSGNLRVPQSARSDDGRVIGHAYLEIGPDHPEYARLLAQSVTEEELEEKRRQWRAGDEALRRQFEEWKTQQENGAPESR